MSSWNRWPGVTPWANYQRRWRPRGLCWRRTREQWSDFGQLMTARGWYRHQVSIVTYRKIHRFFCTFFPSTFCSLVPSTDHYRRIFDNSDICLCILPAKQVDRRLPVEWMGGWGGGGGRVRGIVVVVDGSVWRVFSNLLKTVFRCNH